VRARVRRNLKPVASPTLDEATLETLDKSIEVEMRTPRSDGSISARPIWVVVVEGDAYVRSYLGDQGAWYRRAAADGEAAIGIDDRTIEVGLEPVGGEDVNRQVSDAYRAKYAERSPSATESMVTPEVIGTTLRLTRAASA
jgi:hypothetical protein